ncbi:hypothetical protein BT96DRAFT_996582 [Gymnopus androsaceus JB14]|uniref:Uncharacterized protein n=1 Tax=Gymnopus androsaceus JB14 TaxID=1447944 RepID=A0A6A4HI58_9AGAR|nr:hypothetical protein BT96DRAFT_996582 [Gymnopus androsaceus JB14]
MLPKLTRTAYRRAGKNWELRSSFAVISHSLRNMLFLSERLNIGLPPLVLQSLFGKIHPIVHSACLISIFLTATNDIVSKVSRNECEEKCGRPFDQSPVKASLPKVLVYVQYCRFLSVSSKVNWFVSYLWAISIGTDAKGSKGLLDDSVLFRLHDECFSLVDVEFA